MLAGSVKRGGQQTRNQSRPRIETVAPLGKVSPGGNSQKRIRSTQAIERVRFLAADRRESSPCHPAAHVMGTVALVLHLFGQPRFVLRQGKFVLAGAHHSKDRRPHKEKKSHKGRNRIARQAKDRARPGAAEEKRLAGLDRDAPQIGLRAHGGQGRLDQISRADRNAAHDHEDIVFEAPSQTPLDRGARHPGNVRPTPTDTPHLSKSARRSVELLS